MPGESFSFDQIEVTAEFLNLTSPYTIDSASFSYQLDIDPGIPVGIFQIMDKLSKILD